MFAYTQNNTIYLPDNRIKEDKSEYVYVPLRGYAYILAVFESNKPIGWIEVTDLGCKSAVDWWQKTDWKDQGL